MFLVRWNGGGPLEPCCAWHGSRDKKVSDPCPYFWVHVNGSPEYNTTNAVDSLLGCSSTQKTFEEKKKQSLLQVDPNPLKGRFLP